MQFSLSTDIRSYHSSVLFQGNLYSYSTIFSKKVSKILVHIQCEEKISVHAPVGTQKEAIEEKILAYLKILLTKKEDIRPNSPDNVKRGIIHVRGYDIPYTTVINRRRKEPTICSDKGTFRVEIPGPISPEKLKKFLLTEQDWIYKQYFLSLPECPLELEHQRICIHGIEVPYIIRRNPRIKRTTLKIHGDGTVEVSAPFDAETERVAGFVNKQGSWIAHRIGLEITNEISQLEKIHSHSKNSVEIDSGQVNYKDSTIPYRITYNRRAKRLIIKINRQREVLVVCPIHAKKSDITTFVNQKTEWIYEHTIQSTRPLPPKREYCNGEVWPFMGEEITIRINRGDNPDMFRQGKELIITVPKECTEFNEKELIKQVLSSFFAESLYKYSLPVFETFASKLGVVVPQIKIRNQNTKWGACSTRSITLNLRLCMAPTHIVDYVVAHEISHKKNPDHSPQFWKTVEQLLPNYRDIRDELKKESYKWVI
ncbi:MAG: M48 family metallopeptidase [Methanomicrobiales archaeon]|nr:M48 family metallopeptidase [Methanomicrobiales archaeon]